MYKIKCIYNESTDDSEHMTSTNNEENVKIELELDSLDNLHNLISKTYEETEFGVFIHSEVIDELKYYLDNELDINNLPSESKLFDVRESLGYSTTDYTLEFFISKIN